MSEIAFEEYFPMAEGPGAGANTAWQWRRMARMWSESGVVRRDDNYWQLNFLQWIEPGMVAISPGAVFINGFYGDSAVERWVSTPGDDGIVVAAYEPDRAEVRLEYQAGNKHPGEAGNWATDTPWQFTLWELNGFGNVVDRRPFIPPERQLPPLVEVPAYVPRPFYRNYVGTGSPVMTVGLAQVPGLAFAVGADPAFVPGRNYRVTWYFNAPFGRTAPNWLSLSTAYGRVYDNQGERGRVWAYNDSLQPGAYQLPARTVSAAFANLDTGFVVDVLAGTGNLADADQWQNNLVRTEVVDVGQGAVAHG